MSEDPRPRASRRLLLCAWLGSLLSWCLLILGQAVQLYWLVIVSWTSFWLVFGWGLYYAWLGDGSIEVRTGGGPWRRFFRDEQPRHFWFYVVSSVIICVAMGVGGAIKLTYDFYFAD